MSDPHVTVVPTEGGVTAPGGFRAAGVGCGLKTAGRDLALLVSDATAAAAGVFTTNRAVAAPVVVSQAQLAASGGRARAVVVNSKCANACTGEAGMTAAREMVAATAREVGCDPSLVLVASTGVIGMRLDVAKVARGIAEATVGLARDGHRSAAEAIMTTDRGPKERAVRVATPAGTFAIGGMVKGAGMIEPNLATMLGFLTTDARLDPAMLQAALVEAAHDTFNAITVDGEASTNDTVFALASGTSGVTIDAALQPLFTRALRGLCADLAKDIVRGGEGATRLVAVVVGGARSDADARQAARLIANSLLVKTAIHGGDPNWGRLLAVAGRAGVDFDEARAIVRIGPAELFANGTVFDDREAEAATHLQGSEVEVAVDLGTGGEGSATFWTCDLSAEYVRINADYRT